MFLYRKPDGSEIELELSADKLARMVCRALWFHYEKDTYAGLIANQLHGFVTGCLERRGDLGFQSPLPDGEVLRWCEKPRPSKSLSATGEQLRYVKSSPWQWFEERQAQGLLKLSDARAVVRALPKCGSRITRQRRVLRALKTLGITTQSAIVDDYEEWCAAKSLRPAAAQRISTILSKESGLVKLRKRDHHLIVYWAGVKLVGAKVDGKLASNVIMFPTHNVKKTA